jgi:hypothetical protein
MNKKVFSSLKNKKKYLEEKIEKNKLKIKEYQQQNETLSKELDECISNASIEVMEILKITPFEFLEKFVSGEKVNEILLKATQDIEEKNENQDSNVNLENDNNQEDAIEILEEENE